MVLIRTALTSPLRTAPDYGAERGELHAMLNLHCSRVTRARGGSQFSSGLILLHAEELGECPLLSTDSTPRPESVASMQPRHLPVGRPGLPDANAPPWVTCTLLRS